MGLKRNPSASWIPLALISSPSLLVPAGHPRGDSLEVLRFIRDESSATPLAHLTCVGTTRQEASELVVSFLAEGITHFLPFAATSQRAHSSTAGEPYNAVDLVTLMHELPDMPKPLERIDVAAFPNGHPESDSLDHDVETLCFASKRLGQPLQSPSLFFTEDYRPFKLGRPMGLE